ncbi:MAG: nuclear transport factor 2 family protein [Pseudomonadota bacterium]|nr:nuclear transport factor 2 family protein [Pseudomonadota bacterium]
MGFSGPLEDRIAIQELNAAYGDAVCRKDRDGFAACFAEDAIWHLPWREPVHGREAIVALWLDQIANYPFLNYAGFLGALEVNGDKASGRVWTRELVAGESGPATQVTGRYDHQYVKRDGRWYFHHKAFNPLHGMDSIVTD